MQEHWVTLTDTLSYSQQARFLGWTGSISGTYDGQRLKWQGRVRAGELVTLQYRLGVETGVLPGALIINGAQLRWSNGKVMETMLFQFRAMSNTEIISGPPGLMYAQRAFELTAFRFSEVHEFQKPIMITVHYSNTDAIGLMRETLMDRTAIGKATGPSS